MKKTGLYAILILLFFSVSVQAGSMNGYTENASPVQTDMVLGIDDPGGSWAANRFPISSLWTLFQSLGYTPTGALDFTGVSSFASGPIALTATATLPGTPADGQAVYYTGGSFPMIGHYLSDHWEYLIGLETPASVDGHIPVYRTATGWGAEAQSGELEITEQAADPSFGSMSTGAIIVSRASGDMFYKSATGGFTYAGVYTPDAVIPTFSSAAINGSSLAITYDVAVTQGSAYNDSQLTVDLSTGGAGVTVTYASGDTTTEHTYTIATPAVFGETVTLDFDGTADSLESTSGGDLAAIVDGAVTNSTAPVVCTCTTSQSDCNASGGIVDVYAIQMRGVYWTASAGQAGDEICGFNVYIESNAASGSETLTVYLSTTQDHGDAVTSGTATVTTGTTGDVFVELDTPVEQVESTSYYAYVGWSGGSYSDRITMSRTTTDTCGGVAAFGYVSDTATYTDYSAQDYQVEVLTCAP